MSSNLIATRYAKALLILAEKNNEMADNFASYLSTAKELFSLPEAKKILNSPVMPIELKKELLNYAMSKSFSSEQLKNFNEQLINAGRVELIPEIANSFIAMLNERRGIASAVVTSATALTSAELTDLTAALNVVFSKKLTIENKVQKNILGGLIVDMGNFEIDLSIRSKLESLSNYAQN